MHTLVIGGGVIGLTTAYQLSREGANVTLVDARQTGLGASEVNAGWVVPAEAAPVPGPGMVLSSLKWMLRRDSPLYIRPSLQPAFVSFILRMWRACNATAQRAGYAAHLALAEGTVEIFDQYRADGIPFEMHSKGMLMAFTDQENFDHHLANLDLAKKYGLEPVALVGEAVHEHEPLLSDAVQGALFFPKERHLVPGQLTRALHARLVSLEVEVVQNSPIDRVDIRGGSVRALWSGSRSFSADRVILTTGAWTGRVSKLFGHPLPIRPGKGYSVEVAPIGLRSATNLSDAKVAVTPFDNALRIAGTMEFGKLDEKISQVRANAILRAPRTYFRDWEPPEGELTPRVGMRPMTPDGLPVIGRLGALTNAYVSTGHGMLGVTLAPGSAAVLADLVLRERWSPLLDPFTPARFCGGR